MDNWKAAVLRANNTMNEAILVLDREQTKIIMVSDDEGRLIGTITDGDIRRALIKHMTMGTTLSEFMFKNPTTADKNYSDDSILSIMKEKGLLQIPIVDDNCRIIDLKTIGNLLESKVKDNSVLLMAGGFGTRLRPFTDNVPKPLLKVGKKPILETILNQFIDSGFHNFYISTHYKADMLCEYFGDGSNWGVSINYVHEKKPLGTAGALGLLPTNLSNLPIIVMNADLLTKVDFGRLLEFHSEQGGEATMGVREYDVQVPYGVVTAQDQKITSIVEKPVQSFFVNTGIYVLSPTIIKNVSGESYLDMTHLLEQTIENLGQVNMFPIHEYWLDIGQIDQFERAQTDFKEL